MFCDVCIVGLSLTVGIFTSPPLHLFTRTALIPLIPLWTRFCLYYFTLRVPLLSPLCPLRVCVWCLLGALLGCVRGQRPVNVAFALLIFIIVIWWKKLCKTVIFRNFETSPVAIVTDLQGNFKFWVMKKKEEIFSFSPLSPELLYIIWYMDMKKECSGLIRSILWWFNNVYQSYAPLT
jgi:hypothetical protein